MKTIHLGDWITLVIAHDGRVTWSPKHRSPADVIAAINDLLHTEQLEHIERTNRLTSARATIERAQTHGDDG